MTFHRNTTSSDDNLLPVKYLIAQYMSNPLRKEPRNVGVVVEKSGQVVAKFVGEFEPGEWDANRIRYFDNPNAYRLWVDHWRMLIEHSGDNWHDALRGSRGQEFAIIDGGELAGTAGDTARELCSYLYGLLVGGGLADAIPAEMDEERRGMLTSELRATFKNMGILPGQDAPHPVRPNWEVKGTKKIHPIAYWQQYDHHGWAIEPVDFTIEKKRQARNHAAYARYVFADLNERSSQNGMRIENISVVHFKPADLERPDVGKGLEMLEDVCKIVRWFNTDERQAFLDDRRKIAFRV